MPDMNEYTPDLFTLEDEDGKEETFELIDVYQENEIIYYALIPYQQDPEALLEEDDGLFVILKRDENSEDEMLVSIDDEDELDRIGDIFMKRIEEMFDGLDEEDLEILDEE
ncbi:MAG: DUF1292 domain-containing protein [Porcipelethomonas sp.]